MCRICKNMNKQNQTKTIIEADQINDFQKGGRWGMGEKVKGEYSQQYCTKCAW